MNLKVEKNRVYHPYQKWEDYQNKFYENCSGIEKEKKLCQALEMFNSEELTRRNMYSVIEKWKYSCEHNLTNSSMNKIAYIGQAACSYYAQIPNTITMEAWNILSKDVQERSNKIAIEVINEWINKNKNIQLCLNID